LVSLTTIGKIIGILVFLGGVVAVFVIEYPRIDTEFYISHIVGGNMTYASSNFNLLMNSDDTYAPQSESVCFRISNVAQTIINEIQIPANNLKVMVNTNVDCQDCKTNSGVGELDAQKNTDVCKNVYITKNTDELKFNVTSSFDAVISKSITSSFVCTKIGEPTTYQNLYHCN
jgi:hypothetical protein